MSTKPIEAESESEKCTMISSTCVYCAKEVIYPHGEKPAQCPHCKSTHYIKPPTETKLFLLQKKYLETKEQRYLAEIFNILKEYAASMVKKILPNEFKYHYDKIEEKAEDAASLFIERYLTHSDFDITTSFGGQLQFKVKEVLWDRKLQGEENHESLNMPISNEDDANESEFIDTATIAKMKPLYGSVEDPTVDLEREKADLVHRIERTVDSYMIDLKKRESNCFSIKVLLGICRAIEEGSDFNMDEFSHLFGEALNEDVENIKQLIYKFIKE